jgi:hypothetical protein
MKIKPLHLFARSTLLIFALPSPFRRRKSSRIPYVQGHKFKVKPVRQELSDGGHRRMALLCKRRTSRMPAAVSSSNNQQQSNRASSPNHSGESRIRHYDRLGAWLAGFSAVPVAPEISRFAPLPCIFLMHQGGRAV